MEAKAQMAQDRSDAESLALDAAQPYAGRNEKDWTTVPLRELIERIVSVDHVYFRTVLPEIQQLLSTVVEKYGCEDGVLRPLVRVFENLRMDLLIHMEKEELLLFPAIERYEAAVASGKPISGSPFAAFGGPVNVIEHEHETVGAAVRLIRDFTRSYSAQSNTCEMYQGLIEQLKMFELRLMDHMSLENNVLFARAAALNARRQKT